LNTLTAQLLKHDSDTEGRSKSKDGMTQRRLLEAAARKNRDVLSRIEGNLERLVPIWSRIGA